MSDMIQIRNLAVDCIIGVLPHERTHEQPLVVDLDLQLDTRQAGRTGRIAETCDYDRVVVAVRALLHFRRYRLIEAAAEEVAAMVLGIGDVLERVEVTIHKPHALARYGSTNVAVRIDRSRQDFPRRVEATKFGEVEVLMETRDAGLYFLHVDPGRTIPVHHHRVMRELEWLVQGELWQGGRRLEPMRPVEWLRGEVHDYENRGERRATVFCCDSPPFIPQDEIVDREAQR
jgi:dihydroneopterin aldolase